MSNRPEINITLNLPQVAIRQATQRVKILEWGRGTGKSTTIGDEKIDLAHDMPRGLFILAGETYQQILTRTLPGTIDALEMMGYYEDVHFFVCKRAPRKLGWEVPYKSPKKWDYAIHWYTGAVFVLVSQERKGDGRGLNVDAVLADELALMDEQQLNTNVILSNRGSKKNVFQDCRRFRAITMATSTPITAKGRWIFKFEEAAMKDPRKYLFTRADARFNMQNLPEDYFREAKRIMPDFIYNAEMRNIRMSAVMNGFYPKLSEDPHYYTDFNYTYYETRGYRSDAAPITCQGDNDRNGTMPLIGSVDWGSSINCMLICQHINTTFRVLKNLYVLGNKILDDLANEFVKYYAPHYKKELFLYYDRTGDNELANSRMTMAEQFAAILRKAGWSVHLMSHGQREAPHALKHLLWNIILSEEHAHTPRFRVNKTNARELIISMENAGAYETSKGEIKKDKRPERNKALNQAHTTHLSDAADIVIWRLFHQLLEKFRPSSAVFLPSFH